MRLRKKILSGVLAATVVTTGIVAGMQYTRLPSVGAANNYNYGEAFQKAIMFYEFQKSGDLPDNQRNNWRGDSGMNDGKDVGLDLTGGWYDAGDHVKFNLPMSYTSAMLAWSYLEDTDVYKTTGQDKYMLDEIKWANDYFIKCHPTANEYYYQVGNGGVDHAFWGSAEIMQMERPAYKLDKSNPGSAVSAETAASLAACSMVYKDIDPTYASTCLKHAKELLAFAEDTKSDAGYMKQAAGYYSSFSGFYDELSWASTWIYMATSDEAYLDKAIQYTDNWERMQGTDTVAYKWAHGWDDVHIGASLLLARLTGDEKFKTIIENNLNYWTVGVDGEKITYTPKGLAWLDTWGSLRYSSTTAFLASVYADWDGCSATDAKNYKAFAKSQADYILGSTGRSFVVGFGENSPQRPHHRTAHGAYENNLSGNPKTHRHVLIGALVGGPDSSDSYKDDVSDYVSNEVACDYNAGFTGLMAKMYKEYGGTVDSDLNAIEKVGEELFIDAGINAKDDSNNTSFIEIKAVVNNITSWPARVTDKLSYRYFVDISDVIAAGYSAEDMQIKTNYNQSGAKISGLKAWDASKGIYYVEIDLTGAKIYPGGQSEHKSELQFRIGAPCKWDFTKSPSFKEMASSSSNALVRATSMALYDDGKLVFGTEPNGSVVVPTQKPTATPAVTATPVVTKEPVVTTTPVVTKEPVVTATPVVTTTPVETQTPVGAMNLEVTSKGNNVQYTNSISNQIKVINKENQALDLSKLSIRYYFTADGEKSQTVWCDQVAAQLSQSPWYVAYTKDAKGTVVNMNKATETADCYAEVVFNTTDQLPKGATLLIDTRIAKSDWSNYDQYNDFSFNDASKIAVFYDGKLVSGMQP